MHLTCPACGAVHSLDAVLAHEAARSALVRALGLTPLGRRLVRYLALWRPAKRALSWERTAALLEELLDMVEAARIDRHGRAWPAPQDYWVMAIDEIIARRDAGQLRTPLKSHGYLLEIIAGLGDRAEAQAERGRETQARGATASGISAAHKPFAPSDTKPARDTTRNPEAAAAALAKAKSILKGV